MDIGDQLIKILEQQMNAPLETAAEYFKELEFGSEKANELYAVMQRANTEIRDTGTISEETRRILVEFNDEIARVKKESESFNAAQDFVEDLQDAIAKLTGEGRIGFQEFTSSFSDFFKQGKTEADILTSVLDGFKQTLVEMGVEDFQSAVGRSEQEFRDYIATLGDATSGTDVYRGALEALKKELADARALLSEYKNQLSDVNKEITNLSKARFTGQTDIDRLISGADRYLTQQKLADVGIIDSQQYLQDALTASADGYDALFDSITRTNSATEDSMNSYEAWRETVKAFINETVASGNALGMNVSGAIEKYQTLLMSTSRFTDEQNAEADALSYLKDAYEVHYGSMIDDVKYAIQAHEDEKNGVFDSSMAVIAALENQWTAYDALTIKIEEQEAAIDRLTAAYERMQEAANNYSGSGSSQVVRLGLASDSDTQSSGSYQVTKADGSTVWRTNTRNDFVMRPGQGPVNFSPQDTIIGAKGDGLASLMGGKNVTIENININAGNSANAQELAYELAREIRRELKTI
jgi:chromosome segregation ATPase